MDSKNYIYKIEIELDDEKIIDEDKYEIADIYSAIRKMFADEGIEEIKNNSHTLVFANRKEFEHDFASFGLVETTLMESEWFRPYVKKMLWYNSFYGKDYCEDVITSYLKEGF